MIAADIIGPFPRSSHGFEYLLIIMDMFTRYIECIPIRNANAVTIKRMMTKHIFLRYGSPDVVLSDNGSPFKNEELEKYYDKLGITPMYVSSYHPQANPVERVNQTVKTMIVSFLEKSHTKWDEHIDELAFAYNTAIQDTTGESPAFLNYGRHPKLPGSLRQKEDLECLNNLDKEAIEDWKLRMNNLHKVYDVVTTRIRKAQDRQAKYFNKKHREVILEIGDIVLRRNRILSSAADKIAAKLAPKYNGPYVVTAKISTNIYEITDRQGESCGPVHVKDLKRYHGNQEEFYTDEDEELSEISESSEELNKKDNKSKPKLIKKRRGRPRKTRLLVKRHTLKTRSNSSKQPKKAQLNLKKVDKNLVKDNSIVAETAPENLVKRAPGRPKGSTKKKVNIEIDLGPRQTRASAKKQTENYNVSFNLRIP